MTHEKSIRWFLVSRRAILKSFRVNRNGEWKFQIKTPSKTNYPLISAGNVSQFEATSLFWLVAWRTDALAHPSAYVLHEYWARTSIEPNEWITRAVKPQRIVCIKVYRFAFVMYHIYTFENFRGWTWEKHPLIKKQYLHVVRKWIIT